MLTILIDFPQDERSVLQSSGYDMRILWVNFDDLDVVHVVGVALEVELAQSVVGAGVVEYSDRAHLVPDYHFGGAQAGDCSYFVLAGVGIVYFLTVRADSKTLLLPLNGHLHKNGVDPPVIFFRVKVDHGYFLIFILEEEVAIVHAEIQIVYLMFEIVDGMERLL